MAGVYIHIPYCHGKCAYCDFHSASAGTGTGSYVSAVIREWQLRRHEIMPGTESGPATVYIGGGTPSILDTRSIAAITATVGLSSATEVTIEANPEDVTAARVGEWRAIGINRVSMGVQSLDDRELQLIGRRHTAAEAMRAAEAIRTGGIGNFSLDLIYGLPSQTVESWTRTLRRTLDMEPPHFSAYILSYEPRTRLNAMLKTGKIQAADEDTIAEMYAILTDEAAKRGYAHYEISNFALPRRQAEHNSNYWNGTPYLGLGAAAHSYDGQTRRVNPRDTRGYTEALAAGHTFYEIDEETEDNRFNDMLFTRLRTADGLPLDHVPPQRMAQLTRDSAPYLDSGHLIMREGRLAIPESQWLVSDMIISDLMQ